MTRLLWTQKQDIGPSPRSRFGLAYDSVRKLTYLFGGGSVVDGTAVTHADTWAWDGRYWTQVARFGPPAQDRHTMTFDSARGNTVVFGVGAVETIGATWVFDGVEWTQVEDIGPSRRWDHAAAYDSARQRIVLFGGIDVNVGDVNDTWEWDGYTWTQVDASGPDPRRGHAMAFDSYRNRTVLFGGRTESDAAGVIKWFNDTWEWNGDAWTEVADTGPSARSGLAMTSTGGVPILHGGGTTSNSEMADTWQWLDGHWSKVQEMGPPRRHFHAMAFDSDRKKMVLFGGSNRISTDATIRHLGDTWEAPGNPSPGPGGSGPENLTVTPDTVSLTSGPNPAIQFDIASALTTRTYLIYLDDGAGRLQAVGDGMIPPGVTRLSQAVRAQWFTDAVNMLGLVIPANAWLTTDLGSSRVALQIRA